MTSMQPYFFKHRPWYKNNYDDLNFYLRDVGLATSAAPTYLPGVSTKSICRNCSFCFVDGGVFCNNPALCAYIEGRKLFPNAEKYLIVSLGTGEYSRSYDCNKVKNWGIVGWTNPLDHVPMLSSFMYSQMESVEHMLKNIPNVKQYRFDVSLDGINSEMDDSSEKNIQLLKIKTQDMIKESNDDINRLIKILYYY